MKTIDYQFLDAGLGIERSPSFPRELQKGMIARFQSLLVGLVGNTPGIIAIHGCEFTVRGNDYSMTAGAVFYNNRIWTVDAFQGSVALEIPVFVEANVYDRKAVYSDGSTRDTFFEQKLAVQFGAPGSGIADYNQILSFSERIVSTLSLLRSDILDSFRQSFAGKLSWSPLNALNNVTYNAITYGNGRFVAIGGSATQNAATSTDGVNWTQHTAPENTFWRSITFGNDLFVAVGGTAGPNRLMTSPDGINWTIRASPNIGANSVTWGNNRFVAVGSTGILSSPDGINWTQQTAPQNNNWRSITFGNNLFVAVASDGANRVMTSPDGINWTLRNAAAANEWRAVTFGGGLFVAVSSTGTNRAMASEDGINWQAQLSRTPNDWSAVTYGNGLFVAVGSSGTLDTNTIKVSIPHLNARWLTLQEIPGGNFTSIIHGDGIFIAMGGLTPRVVINGIPRS